MNAVPVGPEPSNITCPSCHASIVTRVNHKATSKTHLIAMLLCCCLCWPCVCLPYCMNSCRDATHHCPNCQTYLGSYKN